MGCRVGGEVKKENLESKVRVDKVQISTARRLTKTDEASSIRSDEHLRRRTRRGECVFVTNEMFFFFYFLRERLLFYSVSS